MKLQPYWHAAAVATCIVMLGCSRSPPAAPERSADVAPATQAVIAAMPPGEHSDPSLVDSTVTANLDVNAPWTDSRSVRDEAPAPVTDDRQQTAAPIPGQDQQASAPGDAERGQQPNAPAGESRGALSSSRAASHTSSLDLATSSDDSSKSAN